MADQSSATDIGAQDQTSAKPEPRTFWKRLGKHLNFYRVHILYFTFTPLLFSVIFYLSNGSVKISYIDSLFNCVSAMAVCGLASVDLSSLTSWQQVILFLQMSIGNPIIVSWFLVLTRKLYLDINCAQLFEDYRKKQAETHPIEIPKPINWRRIAHSLGFNSSPWASVVEPVAESPTSDKPKQSSSRADAKRRGHPRTVSKSEIRRTEGELQRVDPTGNVAVGDLIPSNNPSRRNSDELIRFTDEKGLSTGSTGLGFPRTVTFVERSEAAQRRNILSNLKQSAPEAIPEAPAPHLPRVLTRQSTRGSIRRTPTMMSTAPSQRSRKNRNFGGFAMPHDILKKGVKLLFPKVGQAITRTLTVSPTVQISRIPTGQINSKQAPYVPDNSAIKVGPNSSFPELTFREQQHFAYMEYEALKMLLWVIAAYYISLQLVMFAIIAPYMSLARWQDALNPPALVKPLNSVWFSAFQVVSAFTNTGTSLVDQSMIPFQSAYVLILVVAFLILAGNTCYPIFLRFIIWCLSKMSKPGSRNHQTFEFLLDHPRRCYIYLFPSHQTWFLLTVVFMLTMIDWIVFLVLDLGNPVLEQIPLNVRVLDGWMQSVAVRAAGFSIVPLAALEPAVKVMYVVMMYISVLPIAMSVRSTNVHEGDSLGIYYDEVDIDDTFDPQDGGRVEIWGRYLKLHLRQQLAFDMWWIVLGLFIICIIERDRLTDPETSEWFNIFSVLFELVSAYGPVGLSLGLPTANYSLSGDFKILSKLVVCLIILRGRHRGLPVAIDLAILFPKELKQANAAVIEDGLSQGPNLDDRMSIQVKPSGPSFFAPSSPSYTHYASSANASDLDSRLIPDRFAQSTHLEDLPESSHSSNSNYIA